MGIKNLAGQGSNGLIDITKKIQFSESTNSEMLIPDGKLFIPVNGEVLTYNYTWDERYDILFAGLSDKNINIIYKDPSNAVYFLSFIIDDKKLVLENSCFLNNDVQTMINVEKIEFAEMLNNDSFFVKYLMKDTKEKLRFYRITKRGVVAYVDLREKIALEMDREVEMTEWIKSIHPKNQRPEY